MGKCRNQQQICREWHLQWLTVNILQSCVDQWFHFKVTDYSSSKCSPVCGISWFNLWSYYKRITDNWVECCRVYCRYNYQGANRSFETAEAELLHFMDGAQRAGWKWNSKHPRPHVKGTRCETIHLLVHLPVHHAKHSNCNFHFPIFASSSQQTGE